MVYITVKIADYRRNAQAEIARKIIVLLGMMLISRRLPPNDPKSWEALKSHRPGNVWIFT